MRKIEYYREEDGRWLADIPALPGVTAYGRSKRQATSAVETLASRLIADRIEHGEAIPPLAPSVRKQSRARE
jgi:predicted RNase H-like HicB family nuclease